MTDTPQPFDARAWLSAQPRPSGPDQAAAIHAILWSPPSMTLFSRHYWWLVDKPVPPRRKGQSQAEYVSRNWWRLLRAAKAWAPPSAPLS